jgi:DNA-binding response OmpR family regulator
MPDKPKILVVEDEPGVSMMMTHLLTHAGCGAQTAWNAEKALGLAQAEKFDLITLDINIPGTTGFDIYLGLKNIPHLKNTPVIFVSGGASEEDQQCALELGAADFISKPFEATDFISRIISQVKPAANALKVARCSLNQAVGGT